jgi:hypothetical protein
MAIDWIATKAALFTWMIAGTGLSDTKVVWSNQNGPRPLVPFAEINPRLSTGRRGMYPEERPDPVVPGRIVRIDQKRLTVSCHLYGPGAIALLEQAQEYLDTYASRTAFGPSGLALLDRGTVQDMTKILESDYEERAQLDLIFGLAVSSTEDVGYIQTIAATVILTNPDGTPAATISLP